MPTEVKRNAPGSTSVPLQHVRKLADKMLERLELSHAELSVLLTNDAQIRILNRQYRNRDAPTDVLSFAIESPRGVLPSDAPQLLGDIVISLDTAARQALGRKRPLLAELRWLLAHGLLHLLGFDHATVQEKKRMALFAERLVRYAALPVPAPRSRAAAEKNRGTRRSSQTRPAAGKR
jgi:probable rRNA maturation factor